ncbi:LysR family transcriptional regulator [Pseudomonas kurunegalensis]|nr:LysR family transcriptional regulator [Pseudomonas kurunegalensis]WJD60714.1 LysR family transcriptional regulator [Pseudomonas kurunegalensis]
MQVFVCVSETGSFAGAAVKLSISPQMVAKHILSLEERLGVRLISRTTRRQSLTEVGVRYLHRCKLILAEIESADAMATGALTEPKGVLRISAPQDFGCGSFMAFFREYLELHPLTEIELTLTDRYVDLTDDGFEAAIRIGGLNGLSNSSIVARTLRSHQLVVCASPGYLERFGTPTTIDALAAHTGICYLYSDRSAEDNWTFSCNGEMFNARLKSRLRINDMRALIGAAINGEGLIMGAYDSLVDHLAAGRLVRVLGEYDGPTKPLHLIYRADRRQTAHLKAFISEVVKRFGD